MAARRPRARTVVAVVAAVVVLGVPGWLWWSSLLPSRYSVMDMGYVDTGGGPAPAAALAMAGMPGMPHGRSVATLTDPSTGPADVRGHARRPQAERRASRRARRSTATRSTAPPPARRSRAVEGQLVEVRLVNESVPAGVVLHWHGVDVPGAMDGTAGVTQDAVPPGGEFVYRFRADHAGHVLVPLPPGHPRAGASAGCSARWSSRPRTPAAGVDAVALVHLYDGRRTINGRAGDVPVDGGAGHAGAGAGR